MPTDNPAAVFNDAAYYGTRDRGIWPTMRDLCRIIGADRRHYSAAINGTRSCSLDMVAGWVVAWNEYGKWGEMALIIDADGLQITCYDEE